MFFYRVAIITSFHLTNLTNERCYPVEKCCTFHYNRTVSSRNENLIFWRVNTKYKRGFVYIVQVCRQPLNHLLHNLSFIVCFCVHGSKVCIFTTMSQYTHGDHCRRHKRCFFPYRAICDDDDDDDDDDDEKFFSNQTINKTCIQCRQMFCMNEVRCWN